MSTNRHLDSQAKDLIAKVYHRLQYEAENGVENVTDARWRTAQAIGISETMVTQILKEDSQASTSKDSSNKIFISPTRRKRKLSMSPIAYQSQNTTFDMVVLRRTLMFFYKLISELKEVPTLAKLKQLLHERADFNGCGESLPSLLIQSGYELKSIDGHQKFLVERHEIQMARFTYLKQLQEYGNKGRYIAFAGETYIDMSHMQTKDKKELKKGSTSQKKITKSMPVIIVHAGGCEGFVPNALLMYKANSPTESNHDSINYDHYKRWLTNQLIPNLPENTVIVMNNDTYNKVFSVQAPCYTSNKTTMETWLEANDIPYDKTMNKLELYDLILKNSDKYKSLIVDNLIRSKGFEILLLPPCHPELNPIEKIWDLIKSNLVNRKIGQNIASLLVIINEDIKKIEPTEWENTCRLVEETEQQYLQCFNLDYEFIIHITNSVLDETESE